MSPDLPQSNQAFYQFIFNRHPTVPNHFHFQTGSKNGDNVTGTRFAETDAEVQLTQPGGAIAKLKKSDIVKTTPMIISLMPTGFDKALTSAELRDLMTYLLTESPVTNEPAKSN